MCASLEEASARGVVCSMRKREEAGARKMVRLRDIEYMVNVV